MKYLGIDYGSKRTGIAVSDSSGRVAVVKELIELGNQKGVIERIKHIVQEEGVGVVVIGRPTNLNNEDTQQTETVDRFVEKLRDHLEVPVQTTDERLTTEMAKTLLRGVPMGQRDQVAAQILLQDYLDQQENR